MEAQGRSLILASGSPRRRDLLTGLGLTFTVVVSDLDEVSDETAPERVAEDLARQKARAVAERHPDALVIAADTLVALDGQILGKPRDTAENRVFLSRLSGQRHQVYSGVAVMDAGRLASGVERTEVQFRPLRPAELDHYAASGEGLDKAGGYGIQGLGMALVARIEGDYSNVVGFPLGLVMRLLRGAGLPVWGVGQ
ncbi:Maf family protein [Deinococcus sonorensis]|uniref:dTTP/UTP pyrophosphatase n=2 Tax=Deinococcus sonorensis TaxID=309891 RepID=A0AAU7UA84_9DEIO